MNLGAFTSLHQVSPNRKCVKLGEPSVKPEVSHGNPMNQSLMCRWNLWRHIFNLFSVLTKFRGKCFIHFYWKYHLYVIQTTEGRKNLVYIYFVFPRFFANALTSCWGLARKMTKCSGDFAAPKFGQNPIIRPPPLHSFHRQTSYWLTAYNGWQESCHRPVSPAKPEVDNLITSDGKGRTFEMN